MEQIVTMKSARRDLGGAANLATEPTVQFKFWVERDPTLGHDKTEVSP